MKLRLFWLQSVLLAFFSLVSFAYADVAIPAFTAHVIDVTSTLSAEDKASMESRLTLFEKHKGSQIAVLIVPTTQPETIEQYSMRVAEQWKVGRKKVDDGAILVVAKSDRTLRIEVGYGLEGALNDASAKRIISEIIVPRFQVGDFSGGVRDGLERMIRVIEGEPLPAPASFDTNPEGLKQWLLMVIVLAVVLGGLLRLLFGRFLGALIAGGLIGLIVWFLAGILLTGVLASVVGFLFTLTGGRMGMFGWYSGRDNNGFGSGGFGGGGGGGFGGGGASGRW